MDARTERLRDRRLRMVATTRYLHLKSQELHEET